jgi:hypothetical protein
MDSLSTTAIVDATERINPEKHLTCDVAGEVFCLYY